MAVRALRRGVVVAAGVSVAVAISACGGSGGSSGTSQNAGAASETVSATASSSQSSASTGASAVVQQATASVEKWSQNPTIGVTAKLAETPPTGKTFVFMQCNLPVCQLIGNGMQKATEALGWKFKRETFPIAKPEALVSLMNGAAASPPNFVAVTTFPSTLWSGALEKLKAEHVPVIVGSDSVDKPLGPQNDIYGNIASDPSEKHAGELQADWVIANSEGKGTLVHFATPDIQTTQAEVVGLKQEMAKCSGCKLEVVGISSTELEAGAVPGKVVSYLQSHPTTQYMSFAFGGMTAGLEAQLQSAGLAKKVKFVGVTPELENLKSLKTGATEGAWLGWPAELQGWEFVDAAARVASKSNWKEAAEPLLPVQWLTQSTIKEPVALYEPTGYEAEYKQLWGVK